MRLPKATKILKKKAHQLSVFIKARINANLKKVRCSKQKKKNAKNSFDIQFSMAQISALPPSQPGRSEKYKFWKLFDKFLLDTAV